MIISALDSKSKNDAHVIEDTQPQNIVTALPDPAVGILQNRDECNRSLRSNDGSFLREILKAEKLHGITTEPHLDDVTVDLVFGGQLTDDIRMLKNLHGSPNNSLSGENDVISDHEDPVHNESILLCTYPVIPSFVHVCIYFWFPRWLFLELDFLLWNIVLEVSGPVYNLITRNYATDFNTNFLEVSLLL